MPAPTASALATSAPTAQAVAVAGPTTTAGKLPLTATPPDEGSAQAVAIAPIPQAANLASGADQTRPSGTQSLFVLATIALLGLPALLLMTLLATVLTRR